MRIGIRRAFMQPVRSPPRGSRLRAGLPCIALPATFPPDARTARAGGERGRDPLTTTMPTVLRRAVSVCMASLLVAASSAGAQHTPPPRTTSTPAAAPAGDWTAYGRTALGDRHSPLTEITRDNVSRLELAWTFRTHEADSAHATSRHTSFEATPLVVDGTMYVSTPTGRVFALDPVTGLPKWEFDPQVDRTLGFGDFTNRGVSTWVDPRATARAPCKRRIYIAVVDARLLALDSRTGNLCPDFGNHGTVDLRRGLRNAPFETEEYAVTSPPAVVNGVLVVGSAIADNNRTHAASGEIRGYDAKTGTLKWTFDPVPQSAADPQYGTWQGDSAHRTGAANAWSVIAADPARDLVIVPTTSPSPDYFGGERIGANRYANSVVALRASTGRVVWHFQTVHHDLWDYDNASPPALVTVMHNGKRLPAVLQATKSGMLYILNRDTGEPIFPVEERAVPASTIAGERASPTQPFSTLPPLSSHRLHPDSVFGLDDAGRAACRAELARMRNEGIFTPPSREGTVAYPSNIGGAHWGGLTYDPARELVIVPVNRVAVAIELIPADSFDVRRARADTRLGAEYTRMRGTPWVMHRHLMTSPSGIPCTPPPFGALVAISLRTGTKAWEVPLGAFAIPGMPQAIADQMIAMASGSVNLGGPVSTAGGVVFIAATLDRRFRAFDTETGKELWSAPLPAGGKATPMTYRGADGRQYVAIAAGGDGGSFGKADAVMAFALKRR